MPFAINGKNNFILQRQSGLTMLRMKSAVVPVREPKPMQARCAFRPRVRRRILGRE
jgi:hypothetical protein